MENQEVTILLKKYQNNECTKAELELLIDHIQHSEGGVELPQLSDLNAYPTLSKERADKIYEQIIKPSEGKSVFLAPYAKWLQVAAVFVGLLLSVGVWNMFFSPSEIKVVTNQNSQEVMLPDGSIVWLNHHSELRYMEDFGDSERLLDLKGEAYFEVVRDTLMPFEVYYGHTKTKVLGTSFNLGKHQNTKTIQLDVLTGKVQFSIPESGKDIIVVKGESALAGTDKVLPMAQNVNVLSWKTGKVSFENTPIEEVISVLSETYNKEIYVEEKIDKKVRLTLEVDNEPLPDVLTTISLIVNKELKYK